MTDTLVKALKDKFIEKMYNMDHRAGIKNYLRVN